MIKPFAAALVLSVSLSAVGQRPHGLHENRFHAGQAWKQSPDVPGILFLAIREQRSGHYVGRRTVEFLKGPHNLRHEEIVYRDGPRTRVEFPEGSKYSGQVIVENAVERRHYLPDRNVIFVLPPRREENSDRLVGIARRGAEKKLLLSVEPGDRVAGMGTDQVVVRDLSSNVVQRLYIEPRTGVVLKRQVFDAGGAQIGFYVFTEINLSPGAFDPSLFRFERNGARIVTPADTLREIAARDGFEPLLLPPSSGFRLEQARAQKVQGQQVLVETFSSNHGRLTLFQLKTSVSPDRLRNFARGEFQTYSWQRGEKSLVLVGPRTQQELGQLAASLYPGTP